MVPLEGAEVPDPDQRGAEGLRAGSQEGVLIAHSTPNLPAIPTQISHRNHPIRIEESVQLQGFTPNLPLTWDQHWLCFFEI